MKKTLTIGILLLFIITGCTAPTTNNNNENQKEKTATSKAGTKFEYKIDLTKVPTKDQKAIVDGVVNVFTKRVNELGVTKPNIYTAVVGDEQHIIVELPSLEYSNDLLSKIGENSKLEIKERKSGLPDPKETEQVKKNAENILAKIKEGQDISVLGPAEQQATPGKVAYSETKDFQYKDQIATNIADQLFKLIPGKIADQLIENSGQMTVDENGNVVELKGYHIIKLLEKRSQERQIDTPKAVKVSHILIAYKGAQRAAESITRTDPVAQKLANDLLAKLKNGSKFEDLAKQNSDDPGSKDIGGTLDQPAIAGKGDYVKEFEDAASSLTKAEELSAVIKSPFGYHIIKADQITEAKNEKKTEEQIKYADLFFSAMPDPWKETDLDSKYLLNAKVEYNQKYEPFISIQFNEQGAKLFEVITARNIGKPLGIFVGGQLIAAPNVNEKISGGKAQISGRFTMEEANNLANDLNNGINLSPIELVNVSQL